MRKKYIALSICFVIVFGYGMANAKTPSEKNTSSSVTRVEPGFQESEVVWSDDFNDGNMDGWVLHEWQGYEPNYTVLDGVVYSQGEGYMNIAGHDSSIVFGTWSFDVFVNRDTGVEVIETSEIGTGYSQDGYEVVFDVGGNSVRLQELYATSGTTWGSIVLDYKAYSPLGWHHVDVTRDTTGYFCVYLNSTPILEAIDLTVTTSRVFDFAFAGAFDNVSVSDTVDIDWVAPYLLQEPSDQNITYGDAFSYKLNATDFSGVTDWEIGDTTHFDISSEGLITNIVNLEVGEYDIDVTVADDDAYTRTISFVLTVEPAPLDVTLIIVGGGIVAVVVIVAIAVFMRKKQ